jgi:phenylalanyl-tRNA synthetase beta chain
MEETIRMVGRDLLNAYLFDLYEGKGIPDGQRSLAWSLTFQSSQRTLTDDEVDKSMEEIVRALEKEYGARLR